MSKRSRFYDLRDPHRAWEVPTAKLPVTIEIPSGEVLSAVDLPGASLCADFLVVETTSLWAGITVAVHESHIKLIASAFELASDSLVRFLLPNEARLLPRYQGDRAGFGRLEVTWTQDQNVGRRLAQTHGALWYCLERPRQRQQYVVLMALDDIDSMLTEFDGEFQIPPL